MIITDIAKFITEQVGKIWSWLNELGPSGKSVMDRLVEESKKRAEALKEMLTVEGIKIALSYEEHARNTLSFAELLKYVKSSYSLKPGDRVCVLKVEDDVYKFDIMAVGTNDEVLFSPTRPWSRFIVANPDPELLRLFDDKSMLILK